MELSKEVLDQLVALMQRDGLDRLRLQLEGFDLDLRMTAPGGVVVTNVAPPAAAGSPPRAAGAETQPAAAPANVRKVLTPLVGVFYRAPAPGAKPFVEVGQTVSAGQVLCILEAMKLMNEIVSEHSGTISRICAKDGDLVTLQQELFWIEI